MRLINFIIDFALQAFLVLLMYGICHAQYQGLLPTLDNSLVDSTLTGTIGQVTFSDGVRAGQLIVMCGSAPIVPGSPVTYPIVDTAGNSYTNVTPLQIPQGGQADAAEAQISYAVASTTVAPLTVSGFATAAVGSQGPTMSVGLYNNISGTSDGTGSATTSTSATSLSASLTTTKNGDLLIGCGTHNRTTGLGHTTLSPGPSDQYAARSQAATMQTFSVAGAAGSNSVTQSNTFTAGQGVPWGVLVIGFKPSTLTIVTTAMPDAANGILYSSQLMAVGGAGAYTWSVSAGSCTGLSVTDVVNGIYSGTPTVTALCSLTFQVTDGSSTVTKPLPINVGAAFGTPTLKNTIPLSIVSNQSSSFPVTCNDIVNVYLHGSDTHGSTGWVAPVAGAGNFITDAFGLTPIKMIPIPGTGNAPIVGYTFGPEPASGLETITFAQNTSSTLGLSGVIEVISGAQAVIDYGQFNNNSYPAISGSYTLTQAYPTVVPNQFLRDYFANDPDGGITVPTDTVAMSAPMSITAFGNNSFDNFAFGSGLVAAPASTSIVNSVTTSSPAETASLLQIALRPALPSATCPLNAGTGEKIRRQVF